MQKWDDWSDRCGRGGGKDEMRGMLVEWKKGEK